MSKWPRAKHFTSWLCLAPANQDLGWAHFERRDPSLVQSRGGPAPDCRRHRTDPISCDSSAVIG
jgi:hypothetical protein